MADVARYGLNTTRVNAADFGVQRLRGLEEVGGYAIAGARQLDSVAGQFMQEWNREIVKGASADGSVVVRNVDGTLGAMQVRDDSSVYGEAFMRAQESVYAEALKLDAGTFFSKLHQRSFEPTDADGKPLPPPEKPLDVFREGAQAYIGRTVDALPEKYRSRALLELTGRAAQHEIALTERVRQVELGQQMGTLAEAGELAMREAVSSLRNGNPVETEAARARYNTVIDTMATLDRKITPDKIRALKEQGERSIVAVGLETEALKAFRASYAPRFADRGEAAAMRFMEGQRAGLIGQYGEQGAEQIIRQVNLMVGLEAKMRTLADNANERAGNDSYAMMLPKLGDELNRSLAGNGRDPVEVQAALRATVLERFGPRFAAQFDGKTLPAVVPYRDDVRERRLAESEWAFGVRAGIAAGQLSPLDVVRNVYDSARNGSLRYVSPEVQQKVLGFAQSAFLDQLQRANVQAAEALQAQEKIEESNRLLADATAGRGPRASSDPKVQAAIDASVTQRGLRYDDATGASIAQLMIDVGGVSPDAKNRLEGLIANPTAGALKNHAGFLAAFMGQRESEDTIVGWMKPEDRRRLSAIWNHWRQYEVNAAKAKDGTEIDEHRGILDAKLEKERRGAIDGPKSVAALRDVEGERFEKNAARATQSVVEQATSGAFRIGGVYDPRPGQKFNDFGVLGDGSALVMSLSSQQLGDINSFGWGRLLNQIPGAGLAAMVSGLGILLGAEDPAQWARNVAALPFIGGTLYSWLPVDMALADRYEVKEAVKEAAALNGGMWDEAAKQVSATYFKERGYEATLFHEGNYARTRESQEIVARMVPYAIDAGSGGADAVRPLLWSLANQMINPTDGSKPVDISHTKSPWVAMNRPDLWVITYDGHRERRDGTSAPAYRIYVRTGEGGTPMRVGKPGEVYFRPELSSEMTARLRREADDAAVEVVRRMRLERTMRPNINEGRRGTAWGSERDEKAGVWTTAQATAAEKGISGMLYRGALIDAYARQAGVTIGSMILPDREESLLRRQFEPTQAAPLGVTP